LCNLLCNAQSGNIYTLAGNGTAGFSGDGGPATAAKLNGPTDIFEDASGNFYIADRNNNRVRKINTSGIISTIAGTGAAGYTGDGGLATLAKLSHPNGVVVDASGNVYIADESNNVIRMINTAGIISTIAGNGTAGFSGDGGAATLCQFNDPQAVATDATGNIYIADNTNSRVRMVNPAGIISTIAGGGVPAFTVDGVPATSVNLCNIHDVSVDNAGNIYFTNQGCWHFLRITAGLLYDEAGAVSASYTGDCGPADSADVQTPYGIYPDNLGNVYLCPRGNKRVRKVNTSSYITTVAGTGVAGYTGDGGPALSAEVSAGIYGVYANTSGVVYFSDDDNNVIRYFHSSNTDTVPVPICFGAADTLNDSSSYGYWASSNSAVATIGSVSGIILGVSSGTAIISFTNPACPQNFLVTVKLDTIPGAPVCVGAMVTLTDTTAGGTWSSGDLLLATIGSVSGVVTGVGAGIDPITYVMPSGCTAVGLVTVDVTPGPISGSTSVCVGSSITLSDAVGGISWSSSSATVATVGTDGTVTGVSVGTATITCFIGSCSATIVITVNPLPNAGAITGTMSVCEGSTVSITDATGDAGGVWSSVTPAVATVDVTGLVTGVAAGTSIISYTVTNSCGTAAATAVVTVNLVPGAGAITGVLTVCPGANTSLTDATGTAGGVWTSTAVGVATVSTTGVVTGVAAGTTTISYTVTNICSTVATTAIVTVNPAPNAGAITGTFTVCPGATTNLTDLTGDAGGTWSSSAIIIATVGSTGVVTGVLAGTARISYKVTNSCGTASATAIVTVNPFPNAGFILGTLTVCPGATTSLSDAFGAAGGTWSSVTTGVAAIAATGIVTGVSAGTSTISYAVTNGCGTRAATAVVTVNPAPAPVITPLGDTTFCPGSFVVLTANTGAGLTYQWVVGGTAISGALTSEYIVTTGGSYQVVETLTDGCSASSIPMLVTVDVPLATISTTGGTATMCAGSSITLNANIGVGLTYQWLLGGIAIPGAAASSYTAAIAGDYSVVVTNATGCSATSATITLSVNPSPTANVVLSGPVTFCQGGSVMMTTDYAADYSYQWYNAAGAIAGANVQSYTATTTGGYYVIVTNSYGCTATSVTTNVVVNPLPNVAITKSGPAIFCAGGSVTLSAVTGGYTYQWYVGGSSIAGATNSTYLATTGGGYRVLVTNTTTGCSDQTHADSVITVVGIPVIIPITSASFCWGSSSLLSTSVSGATGTVTYQWLLNGVIIPGATSGVYNATVPGNYSCQIAIPGSCTSTTIDVPVTEFPLPNPIVNLSGAFFYTGNYYVTYQWYKNALLIPGSTTFTTLSTGPGDYKVAVTDTNGCQSFSDAYIYNGGGSTTGIKTVGKRGVEIFPNPAGDELTISMDADAFTSFEITNSLGQQLIQQKVSATQTKVGLVDLPTGVYYITFWGDNGTVVKKFVKL